MTWVCVAFVPPIVDALANIIDSRLTNRYFRDPWTLLFLSSVLELFLLPLLFVYQTPHLLGGHLTLLLVASSTLDTVCLLLYFRALQEDDTSVVASLFSLGKAMVPALAFFVVGERLVPLQYFGFFVIILCATLLTTKVAGGRLQASKALWLMAGSSLANSINAVSLKLSLESVDWVTAVTYVTLFSSASLAVVMAFRRRSATYYWTEAKAHLSVLILNACMTWVSRAASAVAFSLAAVTLVKGIDATQPLFVLVYSFILRRLRPGFLREQWTARALVRKVALFLALAAATAFILR